MAVLPQEMVTRIGRAYASGQKWLVRQGEKDPESVEVALAVESHRWFWKPKNVRTIILTNIRELTTQTELAHRVKVNWVNHNDRSPANSFVRDLYCMGFGEPELVPTLPEEVSQADMSLWHVLAELSEFEDLPPKANLLQRLEWKVRLLRRLDTLGIWIVEASLHGGRGERPLLYSWWEHYGTYVHEAENNPRTVA